MPPQLRGHRRVMNTNQVPHFDLPIAIDELLREDRAAARAAYFALGMINASLELGLPLGEHELLVLRAGMLREAPHLTR